MVAAAVAVARHRLAAAMAVVVAAVAAAVVAAAQVLVVAKAARWRLVTATSARQMAHSPAAICLRQSKRHAAQVNARHAAMAVAMAVDMVAR
jgi:hypothetical protein